MISFIVGGGGGVVNHIFYIQNICIFFSFFNNLKRKNFHLFLFLGRLGVQAWAIFYFFLNIFRVISLLDMRAKQQIYILHTLMQLSHTPSHNL